MVKLASKLRLMYVATYFVSYKRCLSFDSGYHYLPTKQTTNTACLMHGIGTACLNARCRHGVP